jgi:hypothetical protein
VLLSSFRFGDLAVFLLFFIFFFIVGKNRKNTRLIVLGMLRIKIK